MGVMISQVGEQPGAVATVAKTLLGLKRIDRVILSPTQRTQRAASLLERYLRGLGLTIVVTSAVDPLGDEGTVAETVIREAERDAVYFNCSAGLAFFVGKLACRLRSTRGVEAVHAGADRLYRVGGGWQAELADLGIEPLLRLHGLFPRAGGEREDGTLERLSLVDESSQEPVFEADLAFERAGRLCCRLRDVRGRDPTRQIIGWMRGAPVLRHLRPHFTVETRDPVVAARLRFLGADVIQWPGRRAEDRVRRKADCEALVRLWDERRPRGPGVTVPPGAGLDEEPPASAAGAGGSGPGVMTCLGNDPSATLRVLACHRPEVAWILYDRTTPYVTALAARLAANAARIPAGELRFAGVTHWGEGMDPDRLGALLGDRAPVWANVTPGTKAQSWALGSLDGGIARPSSLHVQRGCVVSLEDGSGVPGTSWTDSDLLVTARVRGGPLREPPGQDEALLCARQDFLDAVSRVVAAEARKNPGGLFVFGGKRGSCGAGSLGATWVQKRDPSSGGALLEVAVGVPGPGGRTASAS
ncbi:MAG: hypothetical protein HY900_32585, partial [Deltaproteobacteria bacterium]|nr:hypothetical protein [Deltaproteobacteria bacterium]